MCFKSLQLKILNIMILKMNYIFLLALVFYLTACVVVTAAARNDFSEMGKDYFSVLIKDAGSESSGPHGFIGVDQTKVKQRAKSFFLGRSESEVEDLFNKFGSGCKTVTENTKVPLLECEVSRWWKLKKVIFLSHDTEDPLWPVPGAKLAFQFSLSPSGEILNISVNFIDITINKAIY